MRQYDYVRNQILCALLFTSLCSCYVSILYVFCRLTPLLSIAFLKICTAVPHKAEEI